MPPQVIFLGPLSIRLYGFFVALALFVGVLVARRRAAKYKISKDEIENVVLVLALPVLVGARLYHVLDYWSYYSQNPQKIIAFWEGGIGIYGALIFGTIALFLYTKSKNLNFWSFADLFAPGVALAQAIGRIGNFFNTEGFGPPTNLPWKIFVPEEKRPEIYADSQFFHPTFFYESILDFTIFLVLLFLARKKRLPGLVSASYVILYSGARFFLEFIRLDTWAVSEIKVAQILAVLGFFGAGFLLLRLKRFL